MTKSPCLSCERCGCGSYHDQCEIYKKFRDERIAVSRARTKEQFKNSKNKRSKYASLLKSSPLKTHIK